MPPPPAAAGRKNLPTEDADVVEELCRRSSPRMGEGGQVVLQVGERLRTLQELFGNPHGRHVFLGILTRRPTGVPGPEPMVARDQVPEMLIVSRFSEQREFWTTSGWQSLDLTIRFRKKPAWL